MTYKFESKTARVGSKHTYMSLSIVFYIARDVLLGVIPVSKYRGYKKDEGEGEGLEVHDHKHERIVPSRCRHCSVTRALEIQYFPTINIKYKL